jgi:cell division protein FtsB
MSKRGVMILLAALLLIFQAQLWFGRGSLSDVTQMTKKLNALNATSARLQTANNQLQAEVKDIKSGGMDLVEEKARFELGMIKPNEILVQYLK